MVTAILLPAFAGYDIGASVSVDELGAILLAAVALLRRPHSTIQRIGPFLSFVIIISILNGGFFFRTGAAVEQVFNIGIFLAAMHYALLSVDYRSERLISSLLRATSIVLVIGFFQTALSLYSPQIFREFQAAIGATDLTRDGIIGSRFSSIFIEPSHFIQFIALPYGYLVVSGFVGNARRTAIVALILISLFLTSSALAIPVLLFPWVVGIIAKSKLSQRLAALAVVVLSSTAEFRFRFLPDIAWLKIEEFIDGVFNPGTIGSLNASSRSLAHAVQVASSSLSDTAGWGYGIGGYQSAYNAYTAPALRESFLNAVSGGSLLLRIATELGVLGLIGVILAARRGRILSANERALQIGAAAVLFVSFIRLGGYTTGLIPLAVLIYLYRWPLERTTPP